MNRPPGIEEIRAWYTRPRTPTMDPGNAQAQYFQFHPKIVFLKSLPLGAELVDIGAGDGSTYTLSKLWPAPARPDLKTWAYALEKGAQFEQFDGFELGDWNAAPPEFGGRTFDAVVSCHFIEHVDDPHSLGRWAARKLRDDGRLFMEWPSAHSLDLPPVDDLRKAGVDLMISRFSDDVTHRNALPVRSEVVAALERSGFEIEQAGIVRLPFMEEELMAHFREGPEVFSRQMAYWSWTGWAQFVVARKRRAAAG